MLFGAASGSMLFAASGLLFGAVGRELLATAAPLNSFFFVTALDFALWGTLAIASSVLLLILYSCFPDLRRTPGWQFLFSSLCEIVVSVGFVCLSLIALPAVPPDEEPLVPTDLEHLLCAEYRPLLLTILAFDVAANSWRLLMYLDLIVVYHNPFRPNTWRPLYHIFVALIATLSAVGMSSSGLLCPQSEHVNVLTLTWGLIYAPFLLFVAVGGSLYAAVKALLSRGELSNPISQLARQRVRQPPRGPSPPLVRAPPRRGVPRVRQAGEESRRCSPTRERVWTAPRR